MRYTNPECGLNLAVVNFLLQCAASRSLDTLSTMEIGAEELREILRMTGEDLARLSMVSDPLFKIEFNKETWGRVKAGVLRQARDRKLRDELIKAGAPRAMIERWWPMRHKEFSLLRRMLGASRLGRSRAPTEDEEHRLWDALSTIAAGRPLDVLQAPDYLELHKRTAIDLQVSWPLTNRWLSEGFADRSVRRVGT